MDRLNVLKKKEIVKVYTLWQGNADVHAVRCKLRVTNLIPSYTYQQDGNIKIAPEPLYQVEFWSNNGRETGVAHYHDLIAAEVKVLALFR